MEYLIKPTFQRSNNAIFFETSRLNALLRAEYQDNFGYYQNTFGVYSYMTMTSQLEYRIHYQKGAPLLWQPHNSCAWTPTQTVSMGTDTIAPCRAKINEQHCYDEFFNSIYQEFLEHPPNAPAISLTPAGQTAMDELVRTIVKNASLGARLTLTAGQLHDLDSVTFNDDVPTRLEEAFTRTTGTCRGWIELCRTLSAQDGLGHLEADLIPSDEISADGKTYEGSTKKVIDLYDDYVSNSKDPLQDAIIEGGAGGFGNTFYPMWLVSPSIYRAVYLEYLAQKESATVNSPRIRVMEASVQTPRGARPIFVYMIDNTVVVPLNEVSQWERYLKQTSHFAYLTVSGCIQLGGNFGNIPGNDNEVAVMMQVSENADDYGTHKLLSHALFATAINDTDYITGDYLIAEPA